ncbi:MAG: hypothetical protein CM15mP18_3750 [Methanobacteriota archaeon]|nr:MAG: hypothetical protein CM15mP18_3750 [Euryarchaeota archaeon]
MFPCLGGTRCSRSVVSNPLWDHAEDMEVSLNRCRRGTIATRLKPWCATPRGRASAFWPSGAGAPPFRSPSVAPGGQEGHAVHFLGTPFPCWHDARLGFRAASLRAWPAVCGGTKRGTDAILRLTFPVIRHRPTFWGGAVPAEATIFQRPRCRDARSPVRRSDGRRSGFLSRQSYALRCCF